MCFERCQDRDPWWRYSVRRNAKVWLPVSSICLMTGLIAAGIVLMFQVIDNHLTETVEMSAIKSLQVKASTIQELQ